MVTEHTVGASESGGNVAVTSAGVACEPSEVSWVCVLRCGVVQAGDGDLVARVAECLSSWLYKLGILPLCRSVLIMHGKLLCQVPSVANR